MTKKKNAIPFIMSILCKEKMVIGNFLFLPLKIKAK